MASGSVKRPVLMANNLTTTSEGYVLDARQGKTLNSNLYKLDANGTKQALIVKTGSKSCDASSDTLYVTFSTPFPNACLFVTLTCIQDHFGSPSTLTAWSQTKNGFYISNRNTASAAMAIGWMAIGY